MEKQTALLLIDIQIGFLDVEYWGGNRNNLNAERNSAKILEVWRRNDWPIYHVKHNSTTPDSPLSPSKKGNYFQPLVKPLQNEKTFEKTVNSAFIGTKLEQELKEKKIASIVIVGLTTDHCISTSVRMSANLGFETTLIEDATATFDKVDRKGRLFTANEIQAVTIASLDGEFAKIRTTAELLQELNKSKSTSL